MGHEMWEVDKEFKLRLPIYQSVAGGAVFGFSERESSSTRLPGWKPARRVVADKDEWAGRLGGSAVRKERGGKEGRVTFRLSVH